jgi:SET domain-containing protein
MKPRTPRKPQFKLAVRKGISGLGLFALEDIPRGRFIIEYFGPLIDDDEADRRGGRYIFDLGNGWNIDGSVRANIARYANFSCKPNAEAWQEGRRITLWSRRRIKAGEEIFFDYGDDYTEWFIKRHGCRCPAH